MNELHFLEEQQVNPLLIQEVEKFRAQYPVAEAARNRVVKPPVPFYGKEILEMAIAALLQGENVLLSGSKATGKNILAENLAWIFGRPSYNISFNVNTDSSSLIGTDTFVDNEVRLRRGPAYQCAENGGFGVFDEINMAKNDAVSVLHATLDYRRIIDVPGYDKIELHPATRFIGTMNYWLLALSLFCCCCFDCLVSTLFHWILMTLVDSCGFHTLPLTTSLSTTRRWLVRNTSCEVGLTSSNEENCASLSFAAHTLM